MAKKYTEEEISNLDLGRKASVGTIYEGFDGNKFIGIAGGKLRYMYKTSEIIASDSNKSQLSTVSVITKQVEVDFGSAPVFGQKIFSVVDPDAKEGSLVVPTIAYVAPTGKELDELELDDFSIKGRSLSGTVELLIASLTGAVSGNFKINYTLTL